MDIFQVILCGNVLHIVALGSLQMMHPRLQIGNGGHAWAQNDSLFSISQPQIIHGHFTTSVFLLNFYSTFSSGVFCYIKKWFQSLFITFCFRCLLHYWQKKYNLWKVVESECPWKYVIRISTMVTICTGVIAESISSFQAFWHLPCYTTTLHHTVLYCLRVPPPFYVAVHMSPIPVCV